MARENITFQCGECKRKNYTSTKNKKVTTERLELKKFCPFCRKHCPQGNKVGSDLAPRVTEVSRSSKLGA